MSLIEDDENEEAQVDALHEEGALVDGPCGECGDEGDVRKTPSCTFTGDVPDPDLDLCAGCRMGHKAFYDAVAEEAAQKEEAEDDEADKEAA